jgi:hypothetical protein
MNRRGPVVTVTRLGRWKVSLTAESSGTDSAPPVVGGEKTTSPASKARIS